MKTKTIASIFVVAAGLVWLATRFGKPEASVRSSRTTEAEETLFQLSERASTSAPDGTIGENFSPSNVLDASGDEPVAIADDIDPGFDMALAGSNPTPDYTWPGGSMPDEAAWPAGNVAAPSLRLPLVLIGTPPTLGNDERLLAQFDRLTLRFVADVGVRVPDADPAISAQLEIPSPDEAAPLPDLAQTREEVLARWNPAQVTSDELFKLSFGVQAFNAQQILAAQIQFAAPQANPPDPAGDN